MSHTHSKSPRDSCAAVIFAATIGLVPGCLFSISSEDRERDTSPAPTDTTADVARDTPPEVADTNDSSDLGNRECQTARIRRDSCHFKPDATERVGVCARGVRRGNRCLLLRQLVYQADETRCDNQDNDCDGEVDEGCDGDGDGYCKLARTTIGTPCVCMKGGGDCDDQNADVHPGADEEPGDEIDEDCDGSILCYADADRDSYATNSTVGSENAQCRRSEGESKLPPEPGEVDCNDHASDVHPNATEFPGDEVDQNCDGDEICFKDADGDGYRPEEMVEIESDNISCTDPGEATNAANGGDCNDSNASIHPKAPEKCSPPDVDEDCDGDPNEGC